MKPTAAGKSVSPTFYIIKPPKPCGFFHLLFSVFCDLMVAEKRHFIPVVDFEHYKTYYNEDVTVGDTKNCWEYYFEPVSGYTVAQATRAKNKCFSDGNYRLSEFRDLPTYYSAHRPPNAAMITNLQRIIQKYIRIKPNLLAELEETLLPLRDKYTLGIHYRGTDMRVTPKHPKPPALPLMLEQADKALSGGGFDTLYLCTDEEPAAQAFRNKFGEKLLISDSYRAPTQSTKGIHTDKSSPRPLHRYLLGKEVLFDALALARCKSLLCGHSNVAYGAMIFNNNKYINIKLIE
ncbi:hypothetical protein AGMMS49992_02750 [Clostridia bacterium]|nr:hypothetical protein AGMMS49992_02750 [Clostridia bacterium]